MATVDLYLLYARPLVTRGAERISNSVPVINLLGKRFINHNNKAAISVKWFSNESSGQAAVDFGEFAGESRGFFYD